MAKTYLRVYNREIETLIDQNAIAEAIAHCKNILKVFPKHVDTYRLLGKAFLECHRYADATDVFNRVLSVFPDDFISQIGMSIIREDEKKIDDALWHMERAFEVQPSNTAIQEELKRIYSKRDGVQPQKIRLTHGALVRMYARGELYPQAIAEAKVALQDDPSRIDIEVLLAKMLFICNQKVEAAECCNLILAKLPYCFEANQILFDILPDTFQEERNKYQQRLFAINPYCAFVSSSFPTVSMVPDSSVFLERLNNEDIVYPIEPGQINQNKEFYPVFQGKNNQDNLQTAINPQPGQSSKPNPGGDSLSPSQKNKTQDLPEWLDQLTTQNQERSTVPDSENETLDVSEIKPSPGAGQPTVPSPALSANPPLDNQVQSGGDLINAAIVGSLQDEAESNNELPAWLNKLIESSEKSGNLDQAVKPGPEPKPISASNELEGPLEDSAKQATLETNILETVPAQTSLPQAENPSQLLENARLAADQGKINETITILNPLIKESSSLEDVISLLLNLAKITPTEPALWQSLGDAYFKINQFQAAMDAYTKAEELIK